MAEIFVYSICDTKAQAFMMPFFAINNAVAFRNCEQACKAPNSNFAQFPADYILVRIGKFDDQKGLLDAWDKYENLGNFLQFVPTEADLSQPPNVLPISQAVR